MKKICFLIMILFSVKTVSAVTISQNFDDVFITYETSDGEKETNAINVITGSGIYLYKLYFGEVTNFSYDLYEEDFLKIAAEAQLNSYVYHADELNTNNDVKWYYVCQYMIYTYLYSDYVVYFSDSEGNEISYLEAEIDEFTEKRKERTYEETEVYIYNNELLTYTASTISMSSNLNYSPNGDGTYSVSFNSGTLATINLVQAFNADSESILYVNSENYILFGGGGKFTETQNIKVYLKNTITIETDNPATGNLSPIVPIVIGIPVIILSALVYKKVKKIKS